MSSGGGGGRSVWAESHPSAPHRGLSACRALSSSEAEAPWVAQQSREVEITVPLFRMRRVRLQKELKVTGLGHRRARLNPGLSASRAYVYALSHTLLDSREADSVAGMRTRSFLTYVTRLSLPLTLGIKARPRKHSLVCLVGPPRHLHLLPAPLLLLPRAWAPATPSAWNPRPPQTRLAKLRSGFCSKCPLFRGGSSARPIKITASWFLLRFYFHGRRGSSAS